MNIPISITHSMKFASCMSLSAFIVLFFVLTSQEIVIFGFQWGFLSGQQETDPVFCPVDVAWIAGAQIFNALAGAILIFFVSVLSYKTILALPAKVIAYTLAFAWGCMITAGGYSICFGTTWLWYEPVKELLFDPVLTPLFYLVGLIGFVWITRGQQKVRAKSDIGEMT